MKNNYTQENKSPYFVITSFPVRRNGKVNL
jgi:hypothetical protein